jgi:small subunit ribosomal protein S17
VKEALERESGAEAGYQGQKGRIGKVISNKMDKTVVVAVEMRRPHPRYRRVVTHRSKFKAHDEANACGLGDLVRIVRTRPLSREKRWRVVEILSKGEVAEVKPAEIDVELVKPAEEKSQDDPVVHPVEGSG